MDAQEEEYRKLLDRAFASLPEGEATSATSDFAIPQVDSIIQGNKTIIRNIMQIAEIARRKPESIERFFVKEFGIPANLEAQTLVLNARLQPSVLNNKLKEYFETYVICKECHKPDTHVESVERGYEVIVCEACGARYTVKEP